VTTGKRSKVLADILVSRELVPGYEASQLYGVVAAKNTPAEIIDKLNKEINAILATPAAKTRLADLGTVPVGGSATDFSKTITAETEKWGKLVKVSGTKVD